MEDHEPTVKDHWPCIGVPLLVGSILLVAGLFVGFAPVGGHFDSESFTCGSPFLESGDDGGYGGSEQYDACLQERSHLRVLAWGGVGLGGLSLLGSVLSLWSHHRRPD